MVMFNKDSREWISQSIYQKKWAQFNIFFHRDHNEKRKGVTTSGKWGHTTAVQNIYGVLPNPPKEHHKAIKNITMKVQGIQRQSYELEGMEQANAVITRSNTAVMAQLAQMTVTINSMQAQLKTLAADPTKQTR